MKTAAVICELNPLHNGHAYLFQEAKRRSSADYLVAIMSGNYVQRGEPAVFDKHTRAALALRSGADLVLELPVWFATASAREFARAGVAAAQKSGIIDVLAFGAEGIETKKEDAQLLLALQSIANALPEAETEAFQEAVRNGLKKGLLYPAAREVAMRRESGIADEMKIDTPNNILAVEYLRALARENSNIMPLAIRREGDGYHESKLNDKKFVSATALRRLLYEPAKENEPKRVWEKLRTYCPKETKSIYEAALEQKAVNCESLSLLLNARILETMAGASSDFTCYADVSKALSDRLKSNANQLTGFAGRIRQLKTRQYTYTRVQRALLHIALGMQEAETEAEKAAGYVRYLQILGFRKDAAPLLHKLKERACVPVVTKVAANQEILGKALYYDQIYYALSVLDETKTRSIYERSPVIF